jgi:predicted short-subunit dehydrogenase-like oxidoreductase (DUF2520 family)
MLRGMARKPTIAIVGAGNLGTAIALQLHNAGYRICEVVSRVPNKSRKAAQLARKLGAAHQRITGAHFSADLVWLSVPDREIKKVARSLAISQDWKTKIAIHSSGALTSDELQPLQRAGAAVASVHPLMTFVRGIQPQLAGVSFAIEGDAKAVRAARRIVAALGGEAHAIKKKDKVAYHAWGAFVSPLVIALLATAEEVARHAGIQSVSARKRLLPILHQTVNNYAETGPAGAFSGPLIRGDVTTVREHLKLLGVIPEARHVYLALAHSAISNLPVGNRTQMKRALAATKAAQRNTASRRRA